MCLFAVYNFYKKPLFYSTACGPFGNEPGTMSRISMFTSSVFHRETTVIVISVVAVGSGAPERAPQAAVDSGSSCSTAPGHCCRTGDHQGRTGPSAATEGWQGLDINTFYITLHSYILKMPYSTCCIASPFIKSIKL